MRAPDFWQHRSGLAEILAPLGTVYGASVALKARFAKPYHPPMPVICIGNLTAGGTGKTPVAIAVAEELKAWRKVCFLTRGYGGQEKGPALVLPGQAAALMGDEALLLAQTASTIVSRDRAVGAAFAAANGFDMLVMDDGHQNFALAKTLSLVVVDGETGFGNGRMIPAGPLREPVAQGLARADAVIVMGDGEPDLEGFKGPVLRATLQAQENDLAGKRVFAFAGIGRPEKFVASLIEAGAEVTAAHYFPDHHPYRREEIVILRRDAGDALLVTTEKDWVRLAPADREGIAVLKVRARFQHPGALARLLDSVTAQGGTPP